MSTSTATKNRARDIAKRLGVNYTTALRIVQDHDARETLQVEDVAALGWGKKSEVAFDKESVESGKPLLTNWTVRLVDGIEYDVWCTARFRAADGSVHRPVFGENDSMHIRKDGKLLYLSAQVHHLIKRAMLRPGMHEVWALESARSMHDLD